MNILHINTSAGPGGAALAMMRLHKGLNEHGCVSQVLAGNNADSSKGAFLINKTAGFFSGASFRRAMSILNNYTGFTTWFYPGTSKLADTDIFKKADILHLHNLHGGYFNLSALPLLSHKKPTVWTLHDMWPLTGHCGYSYSCSRWIKGCHTCPMLRERNFPFRSPPPTLRDMTKPVWGRKRDIYRRSILHIVAPSKWMQAQAEKSILGASVFIEQIANGVDTGVFYPLDKAQARDKLGIRKEGEVLLFASEYLTEKRKGYKYLLGALESIKDKFNITLLLLGRGDITCDNINNLSIKKMGHTASEDFMRLCYNAADLLVFPSIVDNQPLVIIEAMACGTPCVAFNVGGVPEMISHMENGYLANAEDAQSLACGIERLLADRGLLLRMGKRCRQVIEENYSLPAQVKEYMLFYERALNYSQGMTEGKNVE